MLLDAGHDVLGIDLSEGMLERAKAKFPDIRYEKKGLQELDYLNEFDGVICIDALEHIFPEDWPVVLHGFREAIKPGGVKYFTLEVSTTKILEESYEKGKLKGLPVVYGEVCADVDEAFEEVMALKKGEAPGDDLPDKAVYHYYPSVEQVRYWLDQEKFIVEENGTYDGKWYRHFVVRKG